MRYFTVVDGNSPDFLHIAGDRAMVDLGLSCLVSNEICIALKFMHLITIAAFCMIKVMARIEIVRPKGRATPAARRKAVPCLVSKTE